MDRRETPRHRTTRGGRVHHGRLQRGQILILFAVALPALAAMVALMVDFGGAAVTYHRAQVALDAAEFAASQAVESKEKGALA